MSLFGQYIENYLDLIENSPNEIIRQITRLHEKNHLYSKLNDKLEETLKILVEKEPTNDVKTKEELTEKETNDKQKDNRSLDPKSELKLAKKVKLDQKIVDESSLDESSKKPTDRHPDKQSNAQSEKLTEKLSTGKSLSEDVTTAAITTATEKSSDEEKRTLRKQRALNSVKKYLLEIQEIADEKLSIVQTILEHLDFKNKQLDLDYRSLSTQASNANSKSNSNSSSQNTNDEDSLSGNQENSNNELNYQKEERQSNVIQSSSQTTTVNNHHSSNSKRASSRRSVNTGNKEFNTNDLNSSQNGNNSNNNGNSSNHKRGVKRGAVNKTSNKEIKRNRTSSTKDLANSPNLYDDIPIDPDEPTYCICEQVSFGEMIGCDNLDCPIEWFHFGCVGLSQKPRGKWYCNSCKMDDKKDKKKR